VTARGLPPAAAAARRRKRLALGAGAMTVFALLVVYRSFDVASVRCEVCVSFRGQQACRSVEAASKQEAQSAAVGNACALIAAGMTDTIACERTAPTRVDCAATD
jgi:hypothetical protein